MQQMYVILIAITLNSVSYIVTVPAGGEAQKTEQTTENTVQNTIRRVMEVGHAHHFNFTPITGRGYPRNADDMQKPLFYGSKPTPIVNHPYVASILRNGQMVGVGTILTKYWVLTTAYNALYAKKCYLRVRVGSSSPYVFGLNYFVNYRAIYPWFNYTWTHSVGLLKTDYSMPFNRHIQPIPVGEFLTTQLNPITVVGFGTNGRHWQTLLEEIQLNYYPGHHCIEKFPDAEDMHDASIFCVPDTTRGPCRYNFGAPVIDLKRSKVIALYLGTHKCNSNESYGAYIALQEYKKWIEYTVGHPAGVTESNADYRSFDVPKHLQIPSKMASASSGFYDSKSSYKETKSSETAEIHDKISLGRSVMQYSIRQPTTQELEDPYF